MGFKKAEKSKSKLRLAIYGLSGGGKTYTSLCIAKGIQNVIGGRIALIDSELGSASKYSDRFDFDVNELDPNHRSIDDYVYGIQEAEKSGYKILVVDSVSHAWAELLQEVEMIAQARFRGNTWAAWSEGTPKQKKLVNAITSFNGHIIVTMRAKTEYENSKTDQGKGKVSRIGLSPEQGKGIEYEFDFLACINQEHILEVQKDRTGMFQDKIYKKPDENLGTEIINWLNTGKEPEQKNTDSILDKVKKAIELKVVGKYDTKENMIATLDTLRSKYPNETEAIALLESTISTFQNSSADNLEPV